MSLRIAYACRDSEGHLKLLKPLGKDDSRSAEESPYLQREIRQACRHSRSRDADDACSSGKKEQYKDARNEVVATVEQIVTNFNTHPDFYVYCKIDTKKEYHLHPSKSFPW